MAYIRVKRTDHRRGLRRFRSAPSEKLEPLTDLRAREFYEATPLSASAEGRRRQAPLQARAGVQLPEKLY